VCRLVVRIGTLAGTKCTKLAAADIDLETSTTYTTPVASFLGQPG